MADVVALLLLNAIGAPAPANGVRLCRGAARPHLIIDDWLGLVGEAGLWAGLQCDGWPPLAAWRGAVGLPKGTIAQLATMRRPDWAEAWTRAGWRAHRALVRAARVWRAAPVAATASDATAFFAVAGF